VIREQIAGDANLVSAEAEVAAKEIVYWAEGSKRRNQLQFANSDPAMARFFVRRAASFVHPLSCRL